VGRIAQRCGRTGVDASSASDAVRIPHRKSFGCTGADFDAHRTDGIASFAGNAFGFVRVDSLSPGFAQPTEDSSERTDMTVPAAQKKHPEDHSRCQFQDEILQAFGPVENTDEGKIELKQGNTNPNAGQTEADTQHYPLADSQSAEQFLSFLFTFSDKRKRGPENLGRKSIKEADSRALKPSA
jgi:hypothetical protein